MVGDSHSLPLSIFVNLMASALPSKRESRLLQNPDSFTGSYPGKLLPHATNSSEVKLTDSG